MDVSLLAYLVSPVQLNVNDPVASILDWISKVSLTGILIALLSFYNQQRKEKKNKKQESIERICRISNALLIDINELNVWYASDKYKILKTRRYNAEYSENVINTTSYQSIVNSGLITYFQKDTQEQLNSYYFYATVHNKRIYDMAQMFNNKMNSSDFNENDIKKLTDSHAWILNENELTKYENEIIKALPIVRTQLNDELERLEQ